MKTNCGSFTITLDQSSRRRRPRRSSSLVNDGFYDDTIFHRIVPGFVIQGGDPTGDRAPAGPGYSTVDKPPADATYTHGVVAMAKTGAEAAGTAGSQFFIVTGADAACRPTTRSSARSPRGSTSSTRSASSAATTSSRRR